MNKHELISEDLTDILTEEEDKKELLNAINKLDNKYKNAIYLVKIEGMSYKEAASILSENVSNIKTLIHRGKKELRKILTTSNYYKSNNLLKIILIFVSISILLSGAIFATIKIYNNANKKVSITPTYTSKISNIDTNKIWVGTFNLIWNDFVNEVIHKDIEFENFYSPLAEELNKKDFTESNLNSNSYFKIHGKENLELKNKIIKGIKDKFNEESDILDNLDFRDENGYILYAMLKKEFNFLEKFPTLNSATFGQSDKNIKYFGIDINSPKEACKNIEILFYYSKDDFAIKLKTKENEEVYLYKTSGENKSFEENYLEMLEKEKNFKGDKNFGNDDILKIPFINFNAKINYDELCGKFIKGTDWYIKQALQTVNFELNNYGGSVKSEAYIEATKRIAIDVREFVYNDKFLLYLKEKDKSKPYLALKVDNIDVLVQE